jgi:hypothetical protein
MVGDSIAECERAVHGESTEERERAVHGESTEGEGASRECR